MNPPKSTAVQPCTGAGDVKLTKAQWRVIESLAKERPQHGTYTGWEFSTGSEWFYVPKDELLALWKIEPKLIDWHNMAEILFAEWRITDLGRQVAASRFGAGAEREG